MLNTTTKLNRLDGIREKESYTIKTHIGMNDIIHIDIVDNATGIIFRNVMVDLKYNKVFDRNNITDSLSVTDFNGGL